MSVPTPRTPGRNGRNAFLFAIPLLALALAPLTSGAQTVQLEMRPHVGDTVRLRFDQNTMMEAVRQTDEGDRTMSMVTSITVHTTAIVLKAGREYATVAASTDSAIVQMEPDPDARDAALLERRLVGQRVLMEIEPNGKTRMVQSGGLPAPELSALFARMPALFPLHPVPIGQGWNHTVPVPMAGQGDGGGAVMLRAAFRLDSISDTGDLAFISIRGSLARSPLAERARTLDNGVSVETSGSMSGRLTLDRRRGWLAEASIEVATVSTYSPPASSTATPMTVSTRSSQLLRQVDK